MDAIEEVFEQVVEKQDLIEQTLSTVKKLILQCQNIQQKLENDDLNTIDIDHPSTSVSQGITSAVEKLHHTLIESDFCERFIIGQVNLHIVLNKLSKSICKDIIPDISQICKRAHIPETKIYTMVVLYLLYEGRMELAKDIANTVLPNSLNEGTLEPFNMLKYFTTSLRNMDITPMMEWINCATMSKNIDDKLIEKLRFSLHKFHIINLVNKKLEMEALEYAQKYLSPFMDIFRVDINHIMGAFTFMHSTSNNPYGKFTNDIDQIEVLFRNAYFDSLSRIRQPHILTCILASTHSIPKILKLHSLMTKDNLEKLEKTSFEIPLPKQLAFHSLFCCPISKELTSPSNPPNFLPCGHVISKDSIMGLTWCKSRVSHEHASRFKCPYCPVVVKVGDVRQITFE